MQSLLNGPRGLAPDGNGGFFLSDTTNAGTRVSFDRLIWFLTAMGLLCSRPARAR